MRFLLHVGADPNIPVRTRSEIPVLVQGGADRELVRSWGSATQ